MKGVVGGGGYCTYGEGGAVSVSMLLILAGLAWVRALPGWVDGMGWVGGSWCCVRKEEEEETAIEGVVGDRSAGRDGEGAKLKQATLQAPRHIFEAGGGEVEVRAGEVCGVLWWWWGLCPKKGAWTWMTEAVPAKAELPARQRKAGVARVCGTQFTGWVCVHDTEHGGVAAVAQPRATEPSHIPGQAMARPRLAPGLPMGCLTSHPHSFPPSLHSFPPRRNAQDRTGGHTRPRHPCQATMPGAAPSPGDHVAIDIPASGRGLRPRCRSAPPTLLDEGTATPPTSVVSDPAALNNNNDADNINRDDFLSSTLRRKPLLREQTKQMSSRRFNALAAPYGYVPPTHPPTHPSEPPRSPIHPPTHPPTQTKARRPPASRLRRVRGLLLPRPGHSHHAAVLAEIPRPGPSHPPTHPHTHPLTHPPSSIADAGSYSTLSNTQEEIGPPPPAHPPTHPPTHSDQISNRLLLLYLPITDPPTHPPTHPPTQSIRSRVFVPYFPWWGHRKGYLSKGHMLTDALAGLTCAVLVIPDSLSYMLLASLAPVVGLITAALVSLSSSPP